MLAQSIDVREAGHATDASGANTHFTFGHYEQAIGHFHRHLTGYVEKLRS